MILNNDHVHCWDGAAQPCRENCRKRWRRMSCGGRSHGRQLRFAIVGMAAYALISGGFLCGGLLQAASAAGGACDENLPVERFDPREEKNLPEQPSVSDSLPLGANPLVANQRWIARSGSKSIQTRTEVVDQDGEQLQRFQIVNHQIHEPVLLWLPLQPSLLHDELTASVQLHSTTSGIQIGLSVVLPHQVDPRSGKPLETVISGQMSRVGNEWQSLSIQGNSSALEVQLRRLRAELNRSDISGREAYANGVVLMLESPPGETYVDISTGSLKFGPVVRPVSVPDDMVIQADAQGSEVSSTAPFIPMKIELDRILLDKQPVLLRFAPDHGEPIQSMIQMGLNAVWIADCHASERAARLHDAGMAVLATPPHPQFQPGDFTKMLNALPPLDQLCQHASAWYTGTRISSDQLPHLLAWSREIRSADRIFRRPQMADVISAEGAASREVDFVGIGRHVVGREESFGHLRNELFRRQRVASQMTFPWMWIQTEPSAVQQQWRIRHGSAMPYVEPEQIMLQAHAALSAGCKGIGFWKTRALQVDQDTDQETQLALELVSLELKLLEPFIAAGRVDGHLMIQPPASANSGNFRAGPGRAQSIIQSALSSSRVSTSAMVQEQPSGPDAAVITNNVSMLILLTHWDQSSQFVPQPLFSRQLSMIVAASETASAWQLSSTGVRGLPREVVAGGLRLTINNFDRHAAILVSSDTALVASMEKRMHEVAERAAQLTVQLADLKLRRVLQTTERMHEYGAVPTNVNRLFSMARNALDRAQHELRQNDFHEAAGLGSESLRTLRQIQAECWQEAVASQCSPAASPHTIAFSTLPDHWNMMQLIIDRQQLETSNLLPSGSFENLQMLSESGWQKTAPSSSDFSTAADVIVDPNQSNSLLRLAAWLPGKNNEPTASFHDVTPLVVTSRAVPVQPGDVVRIVGRLRRGRVLKPRSARPVLLFDSEMGPEAGVRLPVNFEWTPFEIFREITADSQSFQFSIALTCMAEVHLDDLYITRLPASAEASGIPDAGPALPIRMTGQIQVPLSAAVVGQKRSVTNAMVESSEISSRLPPKESPPERSSAHWQKL